MPRIHVTVHEVAAHAGVSIATVSRVLNEPWRVVEETRERVNASIRALGYSPNLRARLLAKGDSGTICFLLCNRPFIHSVHARILQGATVEADDEQVQVVYAHCAYSPEAGPSEIELPRILAAHGLIDGVIAAGTNYPVLPAMLDELELPCVVYGTNLVSGGDFVSNAVYVEDEQGGYLAASHLLELGHTQVRFIGDTAMPWYARRYSGFARAFSDAGLPCAGAMGSFEEDEYAMGAGAASDLLDSGEEFTAVFAGGDMAALGAMKVFRARGLNVPGIVSVVGFNDEESARLSEPGLTTICVPKEEVGAECVRMLRKLIDHPGAVMDPVILSTELIVRESTRREHEN